MRVLDLFSGIGGFSLGLERTGGFQTVAFCEIEPFPRRVLAKHWPEVPIYEDVRELTAERLGADGISVDVICGGFPCQDISVAGKGAGLDGERSGLWSEIARLASELRPRYVIVENVAALLSRGLDTVLGDLAALGYDAEWHCIPASYIGAPHRRDRIWIIAHPHGAVSRNERQEKMPDDRRMDQRKAELANNGKPKSVANTYNPRLERRLRESLRQCARERVVREGGPSGVGSTWRAEPNVGRVAHGVPSRVDRLKSLGNAVVPQVVELIGRSILQTEAA